MTDTQVVVEPPKTRLQTIVETGARLGGAFIIVITLLYGVFLYFTEQQALDHEMRMKMLEMLEQVQ